MKELPERLVEQADSALGRVDGNVNGQLYNLARLVTRRAEQPLTLRLRALNGYDCHISEQCWLCTSYLDSDAPVIAWKGFKRSEPSLTAPVSCEILCFHADAETLSKRVLEALGREMDIVRQRIRSAHD